MVQSISKSISQDDDSSSNGSRSGISLPLGRSYVAAPPFSLRDSYNWTQDSLDIREGSVRLGSLAFVNDRLPSAPASSQQSQSATPVIQRRLSKGKKDLPLINESTPKPTPGTTPIAPSGLSQIFSQQQANQSGENTPLGTTPDSGGSRSSGSTIKGHSPPRHTSTKEESCPPAEGTKNVLPTVVENEQLVKPTFVDVETPLDERTPLLLGKYQLDESPKLGVWSNLHRSLQRHSQKLLPKNPANEIFTKQNIITAIRTPISLLPATILGILLNLLDGVSYGLIMFPTTPIFADFGGIGVSMFFVSCIVSQLVTSSRSIFKGGNGSMMIEVVPFFHSLVFAITAYTGADNPTQVIPTVMVAFALSSILTGLVFFALGALKMGILLEFFPRHILVGCIGGIGAFLMITGLQVTARLDEESIPPLSWSTIQMFFGNDILPLWTIPLGLCIALRVITAYYSHPLIIPGYFCIVAGVFYIISMGIMRLPIAQLRSSGWIFDLGDIQTPFYEFWSLFNFKEVDVGALIATIPTQLALVFFAMLHVPLNVPALALSISEDNLKTDNELVNHGISNLLSGLIGSVPNYLVYTNSVLFYRVGGTTRLSGFMLAIATGAVMMIGPQVIGLLPVMVVGALIYLLGLDLLKEACWDTWGRVSRFEYITIWIIILVMTFVDFVVGIGVGIVVACISFVVTSSRRASVRQIITGASARSTVRRHPQQSNFLKEVGSQIRVIKLQGQIFFGTASRCEATIKSLLEAAEWREKPVRYLVLDFALVSGVDFSAAEAFLRIQRLCGAKHVLLILCGCGPDSAVGLALRGVNLWAGQDSLRVEVFQKLNDALEHCENSQLRSLYSKDLFPPTITEASHIGPLTNTLNLSASPSLYSGTPSAFSHSPRRLHIFEAAKDTIGLGKPSTPRRINLAQPLPLLMQAFSTYAPEIQDPQSFFFQIVPYLTKMHVEKGSVLWRDGDAATCLYLIEVGALKLVREMYDLGHTLVETMLPASVAGEMNFLSDMPRISTLTVERDAMLWSMDREAFYRLESELPIATVRQFRQILLRIATQSQEVVMLSLVTSL